MQNNKWPISGTGPTYVCSCPLFICLTQFGSCLCLYELSTKIRRLQGCLSLSVRTSILCCILTKRFACCWWGVSYGRTSRESFDMLFRWASPYWCSRIMTVRSEPRAGDRNVAVALTVGAMHKQRLQPQLNEQLWDKQKYTRKSINCVNKEQSQLSQSTSFYHDSWY
jgi:hypothetical protein